MSKIRSFNRGKMQIIKRLSVEEHEAGCMYHPKPGCLHLSDDHGKFISSLTQTRPARHAPALDVDFPTAVERLPNGKTSVRIQSPWTTNGDVIRLLDAMVRLDLMDKTDAERVTPERNTRQRRKLPALLLMAEAKASPSSSGGHFHLFIEKEMPWEKYEHLLLFLRNANVIGQDFYEMCVKWKASFLLKPEHKKSDLKIDLKAV